MSLSRVIGTNTRSGIMVKQELDYNNKESDINEDSDNDEEDWKVEAEESDSEIDEGEMSDGSGECRIRAKKL